jgi:hypothetical protein
VTKAFRPVWFTLLLVATGAVLGLLLIDYILPFDLARPPNFFTKLHLQLLKGDPERCFAALDRNNVDYRRAEPEHLKNGCGYDDAANLQDSEIKYGSHIMLRCPALLGVLLWERHVLMPAAEKHFGRKLVSVRHIGTYACRSINGKKGERLSEHAYANAIDIAGFAIQGGPPINLERDWKDTAAKGRFLRDVRDGACRIFGVVLSPDHDPGHSNHFHLDMSFADICG